MRDLGDKFGIEIRTTAAESPFSNGIVERHNAVIYESMMKTIDDCNCDPEIALSYAVSAKNALQNNNGFSPNQLVFGQNFNLPSVLKDELPALESETESVTVMKNLVALHAARKNFIAAESSERIKRALTHQVRTYADEVYENGDVVFYRRKGYKGWKGPATVLGKDGQYVLLRHGGGNFKVHPSQMIKKNRSDNRVVSEYTKETKTEVIEKSTQTTNCTKLGQVDKCGLFLPPIYLKKDDVVNNSEESSTNLGTMSQSRRGRGTYSQRNDQSSSRRGGFRRNFGERRDWENNPIDRDGNYLKCHVNQLNILQADVHRRRRMLNQRKKTMLKIKRQLSVTLTIFI